MPYPTDFLSRRILNVITGPIDPNRGDDKIDPQELLWRAVQRLETTGLTEDEAIATLAAFGESYGTNGELGGVNVYLYQQGEAEGTRCIEWTLPGEGIFCSLGTLLAAAEAGETWVLTWYQLDWSMIEDDHGGWFRVMDRISPKTLVLLHDDGCLRYFSSSPADKWTATTPADAMALA